MNNRDSMTKAIPSTEQTMVYLCSELNLSMLVQMSREQYLVLSQYVPNCHDRRGVKGENVLIQSKTNTTSLLEN